ncbi:hypothetical protein [Shigella boydii]|uniref:hypothetical protein n=1 Tax=Shigella boydii TaxID=621 RepID=UPI002879A7A9|nr:hypothetical protein [Shigella boydii]MDS1444306.1 hypothetical protein [Shigella boydii]MDS1450478.1 hypothetical protein [Shigella boydii]MDS1484297.1 hypothetical protein [Shigella boydii]MDS1484655.1 hypothetical protein [Shigella boydii]
MDWQKCSGIKRSYLVLHCLAYTIVPVINWRGSQSSLWNLNFSISVSFALSAASLLLEIVSSSMRDKYSS